MKTALATASEVGWSLTARLAPPELPGLGLCARRRLDEQLSRATARTLTLVVASAGSGKSVAVAEWARGAAQSGTGVAWLTVERVPDAGHGFWAELLSALWACPVVPRDATLRSLRVGPTGADIGFTRALVNALAELPRRVVLVVDDVHLLEDEASRAHLEFLVLHAPATLGLVLVSRRDPDLAIGRLRVRGEVAELRGAELAFTAVEAAALLAASDVTVGPAEVLALHERTEGWAAALRLAALSLADVADPAAFVETFAGSDRAVSDFLAEEVLANTGDQLRHVLLRIAVADRVCGELADVLTGRGGAIEQLRQLAERNAMVAEQPDAPGWYRCHRLLLELLRVQLRFEAPGELRELHRRAATWFAEHDMVGEALRHGGDAKAWDVVAGVLSRHWPALQVHGDTEAADAVLAAMPPDVVEGDPELALPWAAAQLHRGAPGEAERLLELAVAQREAVPAARRAAFDRSVALVRIHHARRAGDAAAMVRHARDLLGLPGVSGDPAQLAVALLNAGLGELWSAGPAAARPELEDALRAARRGGLEFIELSALTLLAQAEHQAGRLAEAHALAARAVELAERRGWDELAPMALAYAVQAADHHLWGYADTCDERRERCRAALGTDDPFATVTLALLDHRIAYARGDAERAGEAIRYVRRALGRLGGWERLTDRLAAHEIRALVAAGDLDGATACAATLRSDPQADLEHAVALARLALAAGDAAGAVAGLAASPVTARGAGLAARVDAAMLAALAHQQLGQVEAAGDALERALRLVETDRPVQLILDHGSSARGLLERHARHGTAHRELLDDLLSRLDGRSPLAPVTVLDEPLTERELAVLRYLPTAMSIPEIAAEMFLSPNTVRTHVKRIYRKLEVGQRRDAIVRARELRLVGRSAL